MEEEENIRLFMEFLNKTLAGGRPVKKRFNVALSRQCAPTGVHAALVSVRSEVAHEKGYRFK